MSSATNKDERREAQENLDRLIQEGLDSGPSTPMTALDWEEVRLGSRQIALLTSSDADNPNKAEQQSRRDQAVDKGNDENLVTLPD